MVKVTLSFISQGIGKFNFFPQGTESCQNLRYESLIIVDLEICNLAVLNIEK